MSKKFSIVALTQGELALVNREDYDRVSQYKWCVARRRNTRYAVSRKAGSGKIIYLHRFILGDGPGEIAHLDGDGLNCQRDNLSRMTHQQNLLGHQTKRRSTSSNFRGVSWDKRRGKWYAKAGRKGKQFFLGYFLTELDASKAFQKWSEEYKSNLQK